MQGRPKGKARAVRLHVAEVPSRHSGAASTTHDPVRHTAALAGRITQPLRLEVLPFEKLSRARVNDLTHPDVWWVDGVRHTSWMVHQLRRQPRPTGGRAVLGWLPDVIGERLVGWSLVLPQWSLTQFEAGKMKRYKAALVAVFVAKKYRQAGIGETLVRAARENAPPETEVYGRPDDEAGRRVFLKGGVTWLVT